MPLATDSEPHTVRAVQCRPGLYLQVLPSLENMVAAAKKLRNGSTATA